MHGTQRLLPNVWSEVSKEVGRMRRLDLFMCFCNSRSQDEDINLYR
jgi:hypothetical protein